jgi:hypothetical protein
LLIDGFVSGTLNLKVKRSKMASNKRPGQSYAAQRELIEMAKTLDLNALARRTGRSHASILKSALRLSIKIKGREAK